MNEVLKEKVEEIISFARKNSGILSYRLVIDILREKNDAISKYEMAEVWSLLNEQGIDVIRELDEDYTAQAADSNVFIPAEVNIGQKPINVYNLMERLENGEIDLEPGFQRHGNLWSLENQSRLIESLMLKIPIPTFYFNAVDDDKWVVIDGLQRLTAFRNYLTGVPCENGMNKKEKLVGLQYLTEFDGLTFDELPRQYVRRIKEAPIVAYTVEKGTPEAVVYNIFQRINTGGLELKPQEIRQALYMGPATKLIQELAESEEFLRATQYAISSKRMADREYVTRFIAFTELDYRTEYKGNIDNFLIVALKKVNNYNADELLRVAKSFKRVMNYCNCILEDFAFRKVNREWRRGPINKALFEVWSICFSELSDVELDKLVEKRLILVDQFRMLLLERPEFNSALKGGDQYSAIKRVDMIRDMIKEFI